MDLLCKVSPSKSGIPNMGRAMTDTQELRQVSCLSCWFVTKKIMLLHPRYLTKAAGGTDLIKQSLRTFVPSSMGTLMLIDLISYDGFPAMASLEVTWYKHDSSNDSCYHLVGKHAANQKSCSRSWWTWSTVYIYILDTLCLISCPLEC